MDSINLRKFRYCGIPVIHRNIVIRVTYWEIFFEVMDGVENIARYFFKDIEILPVSEQEIFQENEIIFPKEEILSSSALTSNSSKQHNLHRNLTSPLLNFETGFSEISSAEYSQGSVSVPKRRLTLATRTLFPEEKNLQYDVTKDFGASLYLSKRQKKREMIKKKKKDERHSNLVKKLNHNSRPTKVTKKKKRTHSNKVRKKPSAFPKKPVFMKPKRPLRKKKGMRKKKSNVTDYSNTTLSGTPLLNRQLYNKEMEKAILSIKKKNSFNSASNVEKELFEKQPSKILNAWLNVKSLNTPFKQRNREKSSIPFPVGMKVYYGKKKVTVKSLKFRAIDKRRIERKLKRNDFRDEDDDDNE